MVMVLVMVLTCAVFVSATACRSVAAHQPAELALQKYLKRRSQLRHHPQQAKSGRDAFGAGLGPGCYDGAVNPPKRLRPHSPSFMYVAHASTVLMMGPCHAW